MNTNRNEQIVTPGEATATTRPFQRYTNKALLGIYALGLVLITVTLLVLRFRLDRMIEFTV